MYYRLWALGSGLWALGCRLSGPPAPKHVGGPDSRQPVYPLLLPRAYTCVNSSPKKKIWADQ